MECIAFLLFGAQESVLLLLQVYKTWECTPRDKEDISQKEVMYVKAECLSANKVNQLMQHPLSQATLPNDFTCSNETRFSSHYLGPVTIHLKITLVTAFPVSRELQLCSLRNRGYYITAHFHLDQVASLQTSTDLSAPS